MFLRRTLAAVSLGASAAIAASSAPKWEYTHRNFDPGENSCDLSIFFDKDGNTGVSLTSTDVKGRTYRQIMINYPSEPRDTDDAVKSYFAHGKKITDIDPAIVT